MGPWFRGITAGVGDILALSMRYGASGWVALDARPWRFRREGKITRLAVFYIVGDVCVGMCGYVCSPNAELCEAIYVSSCSRAVVLDAGGWSKSLTRLVGRSWPFFGESLATWSLPTCELPVRSVLWGMSAARCR